MYIIEKSSIKSTCTGEGMSQGYSFTYWGGMLQGYCEAGVPIKDRCGTLHQKNGAWTLLLLSWDPPGDFIQEKMINMSKRYPLKYQR